MRVRQPPEATVHCGVVGGRRRFGRRLAASGNGNDGTSRELPRDRQNIVAGHFSSGVRIASSICVAVAGCRVFNVRPETEKPEAPSGASTWCLSPATTFFHEFERPEGRRPI